MATEYFIQKKRSELSTRNVAQMSEMTGLQIHLRQNILGMKEVSELIQYYVFILEAMALIMYFPG
jgi:hypothetical protein